MQDVIQKRKRRFGAFLLAVLLLFSQATPFAVNAADYPVSESELSGKIVQAGDTLTYTAGGTGTYSIYYEDGTWSSIYTDSAACDEAYTVLDYTVVPNAPALSEDAVFEGWYVTSVYESGGILESVTLCARVRYPITYVGTEDAENSNPTSYIYGEGVETLEDASKPGYRFDGWFEDPEHTTEATGIAYDQEGACTLYAKFTQNPSYPITYVLNEGTNGDNPDSYIQGIGTLLADASRTGYHFDGWYSDADFTTQVASIGADRTGEITLHAKFSIRQYTITFDTDGGSDIAAITQDYGTAVTAPADPTRTGHTFTGWDREIPATMPAEDITIAAEWTVNQYTITFDTNGGGEIVPVTQDFGTAVTAPADPARTGYTFAGWDREIPATMPAENMTITARWMPKQYTITFDTDGGSDIAAITQDYGTAVTAPADPTRTGHTFTGWDREIPATMPAEDITITAKWDINKYIVRFVNEDGSQLQSSEVAYNEMPAYTGETPTKAATPEYTYAFRGWTPEIVAVTGAATYTATYTQTVNSYTITFDTDGGSDIAPISQAYGTAVTAPADPTRTGHTFAGWDREIPATMPAENVTIKALWTPNQYTIAFDTDGGGEIAPITQDFGTAVTAPADPAKTGYSFAGWDKTIPTTMPAENVTIKALWTVNTYTITFDTSGGSSVAPITQAYGTAVTAPADPTRTGYTFVNWNPEIPATMPAEDITILARWTANAYTITFDTSGGSEFAPITQDFGTAVTAPADPTRTGYTFAGWDREIPATMPAENMTITARWTANRYNISYTLNGGTNGNNPGTYTYGTGISTLADGVKPGYLFAGWYENADFSGEAVTSIAADRTGDVALYAKFEMGTIEAGTYSLTAGVPYKLGAVTKVSGDSTVYVSGSIFYVSASGSYTFS